MIKIKNYFNRQHLLLLIVVALFYGNTLKNGYSLDDSIVTEKTNLTAKGIKAIPKIIHSYYIERAHEMKFEYRPLVKISFAVEHELFGVNAGVSHFINLLLYLIGLFLLLGVLKRLFSDYPEPIAFYCVLLFAVLPIHTEVVASLKNRDILLCFIFCMIAFKQFILFFESDFKKWGALFFSLMCFYLAFLSKMDALPYLAIVPVLLFVKSRQHFKKVLLFTGIFLFSYFLYVLTKKGALEKTAVKRAYSTFENPLFFNHSFKLKIIAVFNSLGFYINQEIYPFKQCCYYGVDTIPVYKLSMHGYLGILASPLLVYGLIKSYLKKDFLLFAGLFIFCAAVSMYLNLLKPAVGIVADRFAFLSSLGLVIATIALLHRYLKLGPTVPGNLKVAAVFIFILFGATTIIRNKDWNTLDTLVHSDYTKYEKNAFLNYKEGLNIINAIQQNRTRLEAAAQQKELFLKARKLVEKSVQIAPDYVVSRSYLCYIDIYLLNDFKSALPHIDTALTQEKNTELLFYKAICMRETGHKDSAEIYLKKCIILDERYYNAYNLLVFDYNAAKQYQRSIGLYLYALNNGLNTLEINNGLGKTYWQMGDTTHAINYYQEALNIDPLNEEANAMVKRLTRKS